MHHDDKLLEVVNNIHIKTPPQNKYPPINCPQTLRPSGRQAKAAKMSIKQKSK